MNDFPTAFSSLAEGGLVVSIVLALVAVVITAILSSVVTHLVHRITDIDGVEVPTGTIMINVARVLVWGIGICVVLSLFGVNVTALVAAMGIGGIALSLGLQDTIANFLGGLQATLMKIVQPGDSIAVGGVEGIVQDVTWRQTVVKDIENVEHIIPNAIITSSTISKRTPATLVSVVFSTMGDCADIDTLAKQMEQAAKPAIEQVGELERDPWVLFYEVGDYGIHGKMRFVMKEPQNLREARDAAMRAIAPFISEN